LAVASQHQLYSKSGQLQAVWVLNDALLAGRRKVIAVPSRLELGF